ncbi:adenylyltransferase/sulfurtransferase MoeZ [Mycetocola tolaasinivorans]|uniref:Adenylyltransferase/sulfurtransferase MoeZ n=1 Tax=Mycetocola tolaasinivorans TaxID=76635 RepID=A0A3L7A4Q0_9MICO|nr:ThiF family adenylyltransferase [Mycetocola tolaasinivorans]RLP75306.1 adenylyltransferase/sulfurtransferase MoeZ [Mycetocola tolaasinivorans]
MTATGHDAPPLGRRLAPLVEAAGRLSPELERRFARHLALSGFDALAQRRLAAARVAVIGAGGLGSPVLLYLAAAGVGTLGIIDDDTVEVSNLQRQIIHTEAALGGSKVDSAARTVGALNSGVTITRHPIRLDAHNALATLSGYDLIMDGSDNFATRYLVGDAAEILGIPCVWGSILGEDGRLTTFWATPSDGLPGRTYRDLFPALPPAGSVLNCAQGGVLGVLCGSVGAAMATEAVNLITGRGYSLLGRLLSVNALQQSWREIRFEADPGRNPVTTLTSPASGPLCATAVGPDGHPAAGADASFWSVEDLAHGLEAPTRRERFLFVDVRSAAERRLAAINGTRAIPYAELLAGIHDHTLPTDTPVVYLCHHGVRSENLVRALRERGRSNDISVIGGIEAWSRHIDPTLPRY